MCGFLCYLHPPTPKHACLHVHTPTHKKWEDSSSCAGDMGVEVWGFMCGEGWVIHWVWVGVCLPRCHLQMSLPSGLVLTAESELLSPALSLSPLPIPNQTPGSQPRCVIPIGTPLGQLDSDFPYLPYTNIY